MTKVNRNDLCPCGSGKKYKKCCELKEAERKKKRVQGLKGMSLKMGSAGAPMSQLANKVFSVLSSTMTPAKKALSTLNVTSQQNGGEGHCHDGGCGCHMNEEELIRRDEEQRAEKRGFRTLEELIGVDTPDSHIQNDSTSN